MAAVQLQLRNILAGFAVRRRKPQSECLVDHFPAVRIAHAHQRRLARLRQTPRQLLQGNARIRAR
jgi:hypothetical protein